MTQTTALCSICKRRIPKSDVLNHLRETHSISGDNLSDDNDLPFHCNRCKSTFKSWNGLKIHKDQYCKDLNEPWDPPAPITIYCKITNVPYNRVRFNLAKGYNPIKLGRIEEQLMNHEYSCETCLYFKNLNDRYEKFYSCNRKKRKEITSPKESICKSFQPK